MTNGGEYGRYALCREMLETPDMMRRFDPECAGPLAELAEGARSILLTGEGSSRLFPAKRVRAEALRTPGAGVPVTEGATQALEYGLDGCAVLGSSNSGRTRELVRLFTTLRRRGHRRLGGVTAHGGSPLTVVSDVCLVLDCGPEDAVAATKSVVEQAMVWQAVMAEVDGRAFPDAAAGADAVAAALAAPVPTGFAAALAAAQTVYFAGRNDGVAEELALKAAEIARKPAMYLEGTYAVHGIEEVMNKGDVVVLVNPFEDEEAKLAECLRDGVGLPVLAIADRETSFPTFRVPDGGVFREYVLLAAGWNLLVEAGLAVGVDLDRPVRARKVGNKVD